MRLSYSSISVYEACPARYRFQYVERLPTRPSPALSFGESLHRALYRFHDRPVPVAPSLEELLEILDAVWVGEGYADESEEQAYRDHARQVLAQYHRDNAPAYRIPAALEFRFEVEVEGVPVAGVIDRMDRAPGGGYEIVDYKTSRRLPARSAVDADLQLSLYWYAARELWGIQPERLTLYYLLPGQRMTTARAPEHADELRRRVLRVAERIAAGRFDPRPGPACGWCDFQARCPVFRHREELAGGDPAPRMTEVVDEWIALKRRSRELHRRLDELAALIHAFCEEHGYRRLYGSDGAAVDRRPQPVTNPDGERLRAALEPLGLWERVLSVDPAKLQDLVESRTLPPQVEDAVLTSREEARTRFALYLLEEARARR